MAGSKLSSQNAENTPCCDHFWKLGCGKIACCYCCGAKHICKPKCTKHTMFGPLFGKCGMWKNCMSLWREAHLQVKMYHVWTIFGSAWKNCTPLWRETHLQVKMHKAHDVRITWKLGNGKIACRCGANLFAQSTLWREAHLQVKMYKVRMWKNGTSLWRRVHFKVKMLKNSLAFGNSDAEKSRAAAARSTFPSQYVKNMKVSGHFRRDRCRNR